MSDNRTTEFLSLARSLPPSATTASTQVVRPTEKNPQSKKAYSDLRNFHQQAGGISRDIASTSALLQELTTVVKHKSLFQDDSAAVNSLVVRIKTAIENLNARLETAERTIQQQKRALNSQAGQEAANLVSGLQSEFAEAASDFKKVLQERTENLKETEGLQRQVYGEENGDEMDDIPDMSRAMSAPPPVFGGGGANNDAFGLDLTSGLMAAGEPTSSSLPRPHGISGMGGAGGGSTSSSHPNSGNFGAPYSGQYSAYNSGNSAAPLTPLDIQRMEQEQGDQQTLQLIPDQDYLQTRADAMSTVEANIVELGTIFNKLAGLVHEHQEMVQRVEDNVDDANANIFQSMSVLTDTLENLKTNRALALRVFSILVLFIIFFIVFFA